MNRSCLLLAFVLFALVSCKDSSKSTELANDSFNGYIKNYTQQPISRCGNAFIDLNYAIPDDLFNNIDWKQVVKVNPDHGSQIFFGQGNRINIKQNWQHGQDYTVTFDIGKTTTMPKGMETFSFPVEPIVQTWSFTAKHPVVKSMESVDYIGEIKYTDCEDVKILRRALIAKQGSDNLEIDWQFHVKGKKKSTFTIKNIKRTEQAETIDVQLNMEELGVNEMASHQLLIPSKSDYSFQELSIVSNKNLTIYFSDPLDQHQDLRGLVKVEGRKIKSTNIHHNAINVFFRDESFGHYNVEVSGRVKNIAGFELKDKITKEVFYNPAFPSVSFAEKGHIIPSVNQWKVPIKMISTKGFRLQVLKIKENNAHPFYQSNYADLKSQRDLHKYGRIVLDTIMNIEPSNPYIVTHHSLDLSNMIVRDKAAIYKLFLTIPEEMSVYPCQGVIGESRKNAIERLNFERPSGSVYYDEYNDSYYSYYGNNSYFEDRAYEPYRGNKNAPCNRYFFGTIFDQRLVYCSDIGLVVKSEPELNRYFAFVSAISSARPMANVKIKFINYQGDEIAHGYSNSDGIVRVKCKEVPFMAVATHNGQATHMHIMNDKSLSLSTFQVEGKRWDKKAKLFFFGERDVWRPGDTVYLNCIYHDDKNDIPSNLPIKAKVINPRDKVIKEYVVNENKLGMFDLQFHTDQSDPTGLWQLQVTLGNETFIHPIRIETIRPNRLKLHMDFEGKEFINYKDSLNFVTDVKWMHGLPAKELRTEVTFQQQALINPFGVKFRGFVFDNILKKYVKDHGVIKNEVTNSQGEVTIRTPKLTNKSYPSMMRLNYRLRAFEKGGAFSSDYKTTLYSPYSSYVGIKWPNSRSSRDIYLNGENNPVLIYVVDENGIKTSGSVDMVVIRLDQKWWYDLSSNSSRYTALQSKIEENKYRKTLTVSKSGYTHTLATGYYYIEFVDKKSGHSSSRIAHVYGGDYYQDENDQKSLEVLTFNVEDRKYQSNEVLRFQLPAAEPGRYLITIENGGQIFHQEVRESLDRPVDVALSLESRMAPTAYVHVHHIASYNEFSTDKPLRKFGIQAVEVFAPETVLDPKLEMADEIREGVFTNISVAEKNGKRMAYKLAVVDEGLLDLTQFKTPDPWKYFFSKEALQVKTWDIYRDIFTKFYGEYTSLLAIGGGAASTPSEPGKAQRFKPVVQVLGPFILEAGQKANHKIKIDDYVGSVRAMVVATNGKAFGHTQTESKVLKPLMLYATLPRVLSPGERVKLPVTVFAMKDYIKNVDVEVKCLEHDVFDGKNTMNLAFDKIGEQDIAFWLNTPEEIGVLNFEVKAKSGNETAINKIEINLRPAAPVVTDVVMGLVEGGQTKSLKFEAIGMKGTNTAKIELSRSLNISFKPFVERLKRYPYGCIEQTISRIFPQIYLKEMGVMNEMDELQVSQNYNVAIQRFSYFATRQGGMAYWPGGNKANDWGSSYALHFLLEAKKFNHKIPKDLFDNLLDHQYQAADLWHIPSNNGTRYFSSQDISQAYRLYGLALAGKPNYGAMNRLRLIPKLNNAARWLLAHAFTVLGEQNAVDALLKNATAEVNDYRELAESYGSKVRDQALIAMVLLERGDKIMAKKLIDEIVPAFQGKNARYLSTQEMSFGLMAMSRFVNSLADTDKPVPFKMIQEEKVIFESSLGKGTQEYDLTVNDGQGNAVELENKGSTDIYSSIFTVGQPMRDESKSFANDLKMTVTLTDVIGKKIDPNNIIQGSDLVLNVQVQHPGLRINYKNMAMTALLPAGFEFINTRLMDDINFNAGSYFDYQDLRDDRSFTYFDLPKSKTLNYRFLVNATYSGKFWMPPVFVEAMYDGKISAKSQGYWVEIK